MTDERSISIMHERFMRKYIQAENDKAEALLAKWNEQIARAYRRHCEDIDRRELDAKSEALKLQKFRGAFVNAE